MSGVGEETSRPEDDSSVAVRDAAQDPPITSEKDEEISPPQTQPPEIVAGSEGALSEESGATNTTASNTSHTTPQDPSSSTTGVGQTAAESVATPTGEQATPPETTPPPPPQPVFQNDWSKLTRYEVIDRVKGVIYGQAIGDALGLASEFMTKNDSTKHYGKDGPKHYSEIVQDFHRSRWERGDWTDDTDQLLLILRTIVKGKGRVDKCVFAKRMVEWRREGFRELGDYGGMGIGMTVSQTLSHGCFLTDPHTAAREVWERSGRYLAANGAIMRTSILGVLEFNNISRVVANTTEICLTTHADPRCLASCLAVTTAIAMMLQGKYEPLKESDMKKLVQEALGYGKEVLKHTDQQQECEQHMRAGKLKELDLENRHSMGYTFKALGAGFYALRTASEFLPTLRKVIAEAGDADRFGFKALPEDLLAFPHREWLDKQVEEFLATIGLKEQ